MASITTRTTLGIALGFVAVLGAALWLRPDDVGATPPTEAPAPAAAAPAQADAGVPEPEEDPTTATIVVATSPASNAWVSWGKKRIGRIKPGKPLVIKRPRDSGPLDLMVRAEGYLPVQTRAHTFSNHKLMVKLTPPDKMPELLGYRAPLDAGVDVADQAALTAVADGGVPPSTAPAPGVPASPAPLSSPLP